MTRVAVVTTAGTGTVDATEALWAIVTANWPDADVKVLTSSRMTPAPEHWDSTAVDEVHGTPYQIARILNETDQLAIGLPAFISRLLEDYEICVYLGPGLMLVRPPTELLQAADQVGSAVAVPGTVTPKHSLTPGLGRIEAGSLTPDSRVLATTRKSEELIRDWMTTVSEAVLDVDQRSIEWAGSTYVQRCMARADVQVEGLSTLLHWADYAAVEADRSMGPRASIVACDELFHSARELDFSDDPEVAWSMLVHRVHDSRPVEPLLRLMKASQATRGTHTEETLYETLRTDVWRAADPFGVKWDHDALDDFEAWLFEANDAGCTRIADLVVKADPDLSRRFPRARYEPGPLKSWVAESGRIELGFDPFDRSYTPRKAEEFEADAVHPAVKALAWRWNTLKSMIPGYTRIATRRIERDYLGPDPGEQRGLAPPRHVPVERATPLWGSGDRQVNLIGPFRSESGLGQATRASLEAMRSLGLTFTHVDTTEKYPSRNAVDVGLTSATHGQLGDINMIHSNADEMLTLAPGPFKHRFGGRFNVAMWFWEAADLPRRSRPAFHVVDELWVASEYQRDVFGQYAQVPVHVIGLAADLPRRRNVDRSELGWSDDELVFLFVYDALSSYGRKNPKLAMDAFVAAFGPHFDGVRFVLKVSNLNKFPASQREILSLTDRYPAITVIDEYLAREDVMDLMAAADVYVSLHAAEGFGLTLLEAMALGTPVICTGYSGNMDFTNSENSWLVGYDMIRTEERTGPYPEGSIWASPSFDDAVEAMRNVADNRAEIGIKAERAHRDAVEAASLERYAKRLEKQLRRVL